MDAGAKRGFLVKFAKAYISVFAMALAVSGISELQGAGWRPALAGIPLYLTFFILVTYRAIKDYRALAGKPWLTKPQLWRRFKIACVAMFALYVVEVVWSKGKGNGFGDAWMVLPVLLGGIFVAALLLRGEIKELREKEGDINDCSD